MCVCAGHPLVHALPEDGEEEERPDGGPQVALHGLDVVEQLAPLRRLDQRDPEDGHHAQQQDEDPASAPRGHNSLFYFILF